MSWSAKLTFRKARLKLAKRAVSKAYAGWQRAKRNWRERDPKRVEAYRAYITADARVDKWQALVDEAKQQRKRERINQATRASAHFAIAEFDCKDGTPVPTVAYPALRRLAEQVLEPMRDRFGPAHVMSGYRHRRYNAAIGGATQSEHIYDESPNSVAADVIFARGTPREWAAYARSLGVGGVGQYDRSGFVHVDNGPRRDWYG